MIKIKCQKTSICGIERAGKQIGLLFNIIKLDVPCSIGVIYKDPVYADYISNFLNEYLPLGIEYHLIHIDEWVRQ